MTLVLAVIGDMVVRHPTETQAYEIEKLKIHKSFSDTLAHSMTMVLLSPTDDEQPIGELAVAVVTNRETSVTPLCYSPCPDTGAKTHT
jgi:hypothetical protein